MKSFQSLHSAEPAGTQANAALPAATAAQPGNSISARIDKIVDWLKWPMAVVAISVTPMLLWALLRTVGQCITSPTSSLIPLICGIVGFAILWRRWLGKSRWGSFLITLEHESTHALFALLTGHAIVGFKASLGQGGEVRFAGKGNWLITVAPYFFPTAAILLFLLGFFLPFAALPWQSFLLGVALSYHVISTWRETHRDQTDLVVLGRLFCWVFLPSANLAVLGILIAFSRSGGDGVNLWFAYLREPIDYLYSFLVAK